MNRKKLLLLLTAVTSAAIGISTLLSQNKKISRENININGSVNIWLTTSNQKNLLAKKDPINPTSGSIKANSEEVIKISIKPSKTYQQMDGFGGSLTDASAWLIKEGLDKNKCDEVMERLFDKNKGIGISFLRQPMGASDFALKMYTYDDIPKGSEDFELKSFTIQHDKEYIIPLLRKAMKINPQIKIMASPWSPPAWMKTSDNLIGGSLRQEAYEVYSKYFISFINAYNAEGIPIYAITPQNEPLYVPSEYPGMKMDYQDQIKFINNYLGPQFEKENIKTKIIAYDHNWDNLVYPQTVLKEASKYVAGTAWHCYGGKADSMSKAYEKFPDKEIWFTEASGGQWVPPFNDAFADQLSHIIRGTRNYAKTIVWWNIALDQNNGPTVLKNSTCRGIIKVDTNTKDVTYNVDYYTMGHISKFVDPGAYRIDSDNYHDSLETTAFKNPDGSIVLIAQNRLVNDKTIEVKYGDSTFKYVLPGKSAATFKWNQ